MDRLIERCAGLDVHKATVVACVRTANRRARLRSFRMSGSFLIG